MEPAEERLSATMNGLPIIKQIQTQTMAVYITGSPIQVFKITYGPSSGARVNPTDIMEHLLPPI